MGLLIFIPLLILLWFMLIRPQQKRLREREALIRRVQVGDEVATAGGFIGTVVAFEDDYHDEPARGDDPGSTAEIVVLGLAPGVEVRILRRSVVQIRSEAEAPHHPADSEELEVAHSGDFDDTDDADDAEVDVPGDGDPDPEAGHEPTEGDLAGHPGESETP